MSLPLPHKLQRSLRGNSFWETIRQELPKLGYTGFRPEDTHSENLQVIIPCWNPVRQQVEEIKYSFPRHAAKKFSTAFNFKSQLRNFIITHTADKGLVPIQRASEKVVPRAVQTFKLDQNKPPQPPAVIPEPIINGSDHPTIESVFRPKPVQVEQPPQPLIEPPPAAQVLAIFKLRQSDLDLITELLKDMATLESSHPLTIMPQPVELPKPKMIAAPVTIQKADIQANMPPRRKRVDRTVERKQIVKIMRQRPSQVWSVSQIVQHFPEPERKLISSCISNLGREKDGPIINVAWGQYRLA